MNIFGQQSDFGWDWWTLLLIAPLLFRVYWDAALIKAGYEPQHTIHSWITAGMYAVVSTFIWYIGSAEFWFQPFIYGGSIFVFFFDYLLNWRRHLNLAYVDQGLDGKSSWWDSNIKQFQWWIILFIKSWVLATGFSIYYFMKLIRYGSSYIY